jgi:hypothetical protein
VWSLPEQQKKSAYLIDTPISSSIKTARYDKADAAVLKVCEALVPTWRMTTMQSTMIRANMTAYSTAVGPSSFLMNRLTAAKHFFITVSSVQAREIPSRHD